MLLQRHLHESPTTVELQCLALLSGASRLGYQVSQIDEVVGLAARPDNLYNCRCWVGWLLFVRHQYRLL